MTTYLIGILYIMYFMAYNLNFIKLIVMITPNQLTQMTRLPLDHPKRRVYLVKKANKGSAI